MVKRLSAYFARSVIAPCSIFTFAASDDDEASALSERLAQVRDNLVRTADPSKATA